MSTAMARWPSRIGRLEIGEVRLDLRYRCVSHPEGSCELPQRMFDLLLLFAAEPGVLHTRRDLFRRVWSGVVVEDGNLSQSVWMLRKALGPSRRHWIRTVAKSGYVFEPPHPVLPVAVEEILEHGPGADEATAPPDLRARPERTPAWQKLTARFRLAAAVTVALAVIAAVAATGPRPQASAPPPTANAAGPTPASASTNVNTDAAAVAVPLRQVMLIAVDDIGAPAVADEGEAAADNAEAATSLLLGWLRWQLAMAPELQLLEPGLPEGVDADPQTTVVLLASRHLPEAAAGAAQADSWPQRAGTFTATAADSGDGGGQMRIRAWLRTPDGTHQVRRQGSATAVAALAGEVADGIMAHLLPDAAQRPTRTGSAIPADPEGLALYPELLHASQARQWPQVAATGTRLLARAPGFGLAHWHLAQAHAQLRQYRQAAAHLRVAQALLAPTGAAAEQFRARALAWSGEPARAAEIYGQLAARYPQQPRFVLARAQALQAAGQPRAAAALLAGIDLHRQPAALQLGKQLLLADIAWADADAEAARAAALRAGRLAAAAGWPLETERARQLYQRAEAVPPAAAPPAPAERAPWQLLQLAADNPATGCPAPGVY